MKLTDREKLVLLVGPVAVILAGYASWFNLFQRAKLQATESAHAAAVAGQVSEAELAHERTLKLALAREVKQTEEEKRRLDARADAVLGQSVDSQGRIQAGRQLTDLFSRHGLQVLDEEPAAKGSETKLPQSLAGAIDRLGKDRLGKDRLAKDRGQKTPQTTPVRRLQIVGRYLDLMEAVQELAQAGNPPGVPIRLAMAESDAVSEARKWTLWVWMRAETEGGKPNAERGKLAGEGGGRINYVY